MKVVLFEIYDSGIGIAVSLRYRSGKELNYQELEKLKEYVMQLIADKHALEPKGNIQ